MISLVNYDVANEFLAALPCMALDFATEVPASDEKDDSIPQNEWVLRV
jgi:hypothetical protein